MSDSDILTKLRDLVKEQIKQGQENISLDELYKIVYPRPHRCYRSIDELNWVWIEEENNKLVLQRWYWDYYDGRTHSDTIIKCCPYCGFIL